MSDYKPFSIYDNDEEKNKPVSIPRDLSENAGDLNLEIEDIPSADDEKTREDLLRQLGGGWLMNILQGLDDILQVVINIIIGLSELNPTSYAQRAGAARACDRRNTGGYSDR